jgi:RimJ/RimL family protein N-acetyltransferase
MRTSAHHPEFIDLEIEKDEKVYLAEIGRSDGGGIYRDIVQYDKERLVALGFPTEHIDVSDMVDSLIEQMKAGNVLAYTIRQMYGQDIDAYSVAHGLVVLSLLQEKPGEANMGYIMRSHSMVAGHGYATAAASALANYAFENLGLENITVPSSGGRPASVHVAQMLGASIIEGSYVLDNGQTAAS